MKTAAMSAAFATRLGTRRQPEASEVRRFSQPGSASPLPAWASVLPADALGAPPAGSSQTQRRGWLCERTRPRGSTVQALTSHSPWDRARGRLAPAGADRRDDRARIEAARPEGRRDALEAAARSSRFRRCRGSGRRTDRRARCAEWRSWWPRDHHCANMQSGAANAGLALACYRTRDRADYSSGMDHRRIAVYVQPSCRRCSVAIALCTRSVRRGGSRRSKVARCAFNCFFKRSQIQFFRGPSLPSRLLLCASLPGAPRLSSHADFLAVLRVFATTHS